MSAVVVLNVLAALIIVCLLLATLRSGTAVPDRARVPTTKR